MKAIAIHEHGGAEKLSYEDVPTPQPGPGEILVRIRAAGVNHFDHDIREGVSGVGQSFPHVLGVEGAGEVVELGPGVDAVAEGDRVTLLIKRHCGHCRYCIGGLEQLCPNSRDLMGVTTWGTFAEYVVVGQHQAVRLPDSLSFEDAAASTVCFSTAWQMVVSLGRLQPGETALVNAAGSGVGSSAIQICKLAGARVIATARTSEKLEKAKALGADSLINYSEARLADEALRLTDGEGVDLVVESVGGEVLVQSIEALRLTGRLVTCGAHAGERVELDIIQLFRKQIALYGNYIAPKVQVRHVLGLVAQGRLKPVIHAKFALADARNAAEITAGRGVFGKMLLIP